MNIKKAVPVLALTAGLLLPSTVGAQDDKVVFGALSSGASVVHSSCNEIQPEPKGGEIRDNVLPMTVFLPIAFNLEGIQFCPSVGGGTDALLLQDGVALVGEYGGTQRLFSTSIAASPYPEDSNLYEMPMTGDEMIALSEQPDPVDTSSLRLLGIYNFSSSSGERLPGDSMLRRADIMKRFEANTRNMPSTARLIRLSTNTFVNNVPFQVGSIPLGAICPVMEGFHLATFEGFMLNPMELNILIKVRYTSTTVALCGQQIEQYQWVPYQSAAPAMNQVILGQAIQQSDLMFNEWRIPVGVFGEDGITVRDAVVSFTVAAGVVAIGINVIGGGGSIALLSTQ